MVNRIEHPDEATWDRLAHGEVAAPERDALFDHITACESCSQIWRGILTLRSEAQDQGLIPRDVPARAAWLRSPAVYLAVAATLVAVISGVVLNRQTVADLSGDRSAMRSSGAAIVDGLSSATVNGATTLAWTPLAGAASYRVSVFSGDGLPVWTRDAAAPPMAWPADVARAAGLYRWRVEALGDGTVQATSRLAILEVAR
jgi:alkylhydroperoxidase family enzyme